MVCWWVTSKMKSLRGEKNQGSLWKREFCHQTDFRLELKYQLLGLWTAGLSSRSQCVNLHNHISKLLKINVSLYI